MGRKKHISVYCLEEMGAVIYWGWERNKTHCLPRTSQGTEADHKHTGCLTDNHPEICLRGSYEHSNKKLYLNLGKKFSSLAGFVISVTMIGYPWKYHKSRQTCLSKKTQGSWHEVQKSWFGFGVLFKRLIVVYANFLIYWFQ